jgi:hypothetical protein
VSLAFARGEIGGPRFAGLRETDVQSVAFELPDAEAFSH